MGIINQRKSNRCDFCFGYHAENQNFKIVSIAIQIKENFPSIWCYLVSFAIQTQKFLKMKNSERQVLKIFPKNRSKNSVYNHKKVLLSFALTNPDTQPIF